MNAVKELERILEKLNKIQDEYDFDDKNEAIKKAINFVNRVRIDLICEAGRKKQNG